MGADYYFPHFHCHGWRRTARYGLVPPLAPQSPLRAFAASLVVCAPTPVWFLSVLVSALSNPWYSVVRPCSSWSPSRRLLLTLDPTTARLPQFDRSVDFRLGRSVTLFFVAWSPDVNRSVFGADRTISFFDEGRGVPTKII
ncbi:hypothetical protein LR48_Vigan10g060800 [Vigna angularis]|uniref:Uncharacterized protein n=1 Tax=Phaseolus angularis TaxID=3914 RepID=A0A0L9VI33_PHAAN|nr:hypothetical protein LR48_Vigan10g060800 [Vigna angularis]